MYMGKVTFEVSALHIENFEFCMVILVVVVVWSVVERLIESWVALVPGSWVSVPHGRPSFVQDGIPGVVCVPILDSYE